MYLNKQMFWMLVVYAALIGMLWAIFTPSEAQTQEFKFELRCEVVPIPADDPEEQEEQEEQEEMALSCQDSYGSVAAQMCADNGDLCRFFSNKPATDSCAKQCASVGGVAVQTYDDSGVNGRCTVKAGSNPKPSDSTAWSSRICECEKVVADEQASNVHTPNDYWQDFSAGGPYTPGALRALN